MCTHQEFLTGIGNGTLRFRVNPGVYHTETEAKLSSGYRHADTAAKGVSMLLLIMAFPLYLVFSWLLAALSIAASVWVFLYFGRLNYRVFVRAQVKDDKKFFDQCQKNSVIIIMETGKQTNVHKDAAPTLKVLIATHNQAKLKRYKNILASIEKLELVSLKDMKITEEADEPYKSAAKNAAHKAKFYGDISKLITVAVDEALTTNFLPPDSQPGVLVRRIKKNREVATDKELLAFWEETISLYDTENKKFIWNYSVAYYDPTINRTGSIKIERIDSVAQTFSTKIMKGYPMSSFLIGPGQSKPFSELSATETKESDIEYSGDLLKDFPAWLDKS